MNVVFSPMADAILGRHSDFRDGLVRTLAGLPGACSIDGKVGRAPADDRVVLLCQGRETITVSHEDLGDAAAAGRAVKPWSVPTPE